MWGEDTAFLELFWAGCARQGQGPTDQRAEILSAEGTAGPGGAGAQPCLPRAKPSRQHPGIRSHLWAATDPGDGDQG